MTNEPHDTSLDDELVFTTHGTSIDEAFGDYEDEDDVNECEEDDYSEGKYED